MPIFVKSLVGGKLVEARELVLSAISRLRQSGELLSKDEEFVFVEETDSQIPVAPQPGRELKPKPKPNPGRETVRVLVTQPVLGYMISVPVPSEMVISDSEPWKLQNKNDIWHEAVLIDVTRSEHRAVCTFFDSTCGYVTVTGDVV